MRVLANEKTVFLFDNWSGKGGDYMTVSLRRRQKALFIVIGYIDNIA